MRELWEVTSSEDRVGFNRGCFCNDQGLCFTCQLETTIYQHHGFKGLNFFRGLLNGSFGKNCDKCGLRLAPCERISSIGASTATSAVLRKRPK
jgi:hypothetical protein